MKAVALFVASTLLIVAVGSWVFTLVYPTAEGTRAVLTSAGTAVVVQLLSFAILLVARRSNPIAAWGLGTLLRMGVLAIYALVVVQALGLASAPALISLATFFFLSSLVEPLLLNV
jgi:hypothetical protein